MKTFTIGNVDICYEVFGDKNTKNMVLISGLGSQMIRWEDSFCRLLACQGFRVIRFDNRDSGASVFHGHEEIDSGKSIEEQFASLTPHTIPYSLMDMAHDVIGLLDHLKIDKAHIAGRSMGGIIGQLLSSFYPERVITLTVIMSTSLHPDLPPTAPEVLQLMTKPGTDPAANKEQYIRERIYFAEKISGTKYPLDHHHEKALITEELRRSKTPNGIIRQLMAMGSYCYDPEVLKKITVPTLIIHGTDDLIFHPECAKNLAGSVSSSQLVLVDGMGHSIPNELHDFIGKTIVDFTQYQ